MAREAGIFGRYNELEYTVHSTDDGELYSAGNSPLESQGYVNVENGAGLETMRDLCEIA